MKNKKTPLNLPLIPQWRDRLRETLNKYGNSKGQSLVDVIFAIGIVVLMLTGVVVLIINTSSLKTANLERNKANELAQKLMEAKIKYIKEDFSFWGSSHPSESVSPVVDPPGFDKYSYTITYNPCSTRACKIIIKVTWGDNKNLSVERFFYMNGK